MDEFKLPSGMALETIEFRSTKYIPWTPTPPQQVFLAMDTVKEILYGGAAGGGKSIALLMAALQYVDVPEYAALLLRRTYADLIKPESLMDVAREWLTNTDARWNDNEKTWFFPSGATLTFGYLDVEKDKLNYQGAAFQFIGFDELTQHLEKSYKYLFSRLRRKAKSKSTIPLRMRAASNPGGPGHDWVKLRFIDTVAKNRFFIPALIADNPYLDRESYVESLSELDPVELEQLLNGAWEVAEKGGIFDPEGLVLKISAPEPYVSMRVRGWDLAATKDGGDETTGVLMSISMDMKIITVEDVVHGHWSATERDIVMEQTMESDLQEYARSGTPVMQVIEQQPAAAGKGEAEKMAAAFGRYPVEFVRSTGKKLHRALPYSKAVGNHRVRLVSAPWNGPYTSQLITWKGGDHEKDDHIDGSSIAYTKLYTEGLRFTPPAVDRPLTLSPRPARLLAHREADRGRLAPRASWGDDFND